MRHSDFAWLALFALLGCAKPASVTIGQLITDAESNRFTALDEPEGEAYEPGPPAARSPCCRAAGSSGSATHDLRAPR